MERRLAVLACVVVLGCWGCGEKEENEGDKIKLGLLLPLTGSLQTFGVSIQKAALLAASEINDAGGVLGKEIAFKTVDDATDPDLAVGGATSLIEEGVVAIVGPVASSASLKVWNEVMKDNPKRVPILVTGTSPDITNLDDNGYVWRCMPSDVYQGATGAVVAMEELAKAGKTAPSAGAIYLDNEWGSRLKEAFKKDFEAAGGTMDATDVVKYPAMDDATLDAYTFAEEAKTLFAHQPDVVYVASYAKDGAKITAAMKPYISQAYKPLIFGTDAVYSSSFLSNGEPTVIDGMIGTVPSPPRTEKNYAAYATAFEAKFNTKPEAYTAEAYDAVYLYALAMQRAGTADPAIFASNLIPVSGPPGQEITGGQWADALTALQKGKDTVDYRGASGPVEWDAKGDITEGFYEIWKVEKDGSSFKFTAIDNRKFKVDSSN